MPTSDGVEYVATDNGAGVYPGPDYQQLELATATQDAEQQQEAFVVYHMQTRAMNQPGIASFVKFATYRDVPSARSPRATDQPPATEEATSP